MAKQSDEADIRLSPFELKDKLIALASRAPERILLNAGRGDPNFLATLPRRAFLRLLEFALQEAERSYSYLNSQFGGLPEVAGIDLRFEIFAHRHEDRDGIGFLRRAIAYVKDRLGLDQEAFLSEMVTAALGCSYPVPPRMLDISETIVKAYLTQELFGTGRRHGDFSLFATEGATAAMVYAFEALEANGLVAPGDKIALATPIFSPYLEIPALSEYRLDIVEIRANEEAAWQIPDSELCKLVAPEIKVLCLVNPSNPTSVKLSEPCLASLSELVRNQRPDLFILTDDVYATFADEFVSLFAVCPRNTLCVYSFSKYFGATGWRLGAIALHEDNVFDEALASQPEEVREQLARRYAILTRHADQLRFIDRLVAESRSVALNHTAGLSTPQQLQMVLFALSGLMDSGEIYKSAAKDLIRARYRTLCQHIGIAPEVGPNDVHYYYLIDLHQLGARLHGKAFADWLSAGKRGREFVFRLARETGVVLLPGRGFEVADASVRVSLANLTEAEYVAIGKCTRQVLDELFGEFKAEEEKGV